MMRPSIVFSLVLFGALAGCQPVPEFVPLPGAAAGNTAEPHILPLKTVLAQAGTVTISERDTASLEGRAEALRRRAAALRARNIGD